MKHIDNKEELQNTLFKEYQKWLIMYQKDDRAVIQNYCLNQMRDTRDLYKKYGFDIQDLKDITPGVINVGWR